MSASSPFHAPITRCLHDLLAHLGVREAGATAELGELLRDFGGAKARLGRKAVAERLGLNESDLTEFDRALRRGAEALAGSADRNAEIACLRLLLWFETIWAQALGRVLEVRVPTRSDEDVAQKQVRAIELICRAVLAEKHGSQPQLVAWLREAFRPEIVDKWVKSGSPGDVLSGTTFSELAGIFVSDESFARYREIFERTEHLSFSGDKRRTLQAFLEDVRRIRNTFAHHKAVSPLQLALLERYFEEMSAPVQAAFDRGETQVNPDAYIDVSREELASYFAGVHEDLQEVRGDLAALKAALESRLDLIGTEVAGTARTVQRVDRRLQYTLGGVAALLLIGGLTVYFAREAGRKADAIRGDTAQIKADTTAVAQAAQKAEAATAAVQSGVSKVEEQARQLGTQAEALRKDGAETKAAAQEAATAAKAASVGLQEAAGRMEGAAQKTAEAVREVAGTVQAVASLGGIIPNPVSPDDFYRNARLYELRNEFAAARRNYETFLASKPLHLDPYLSYADLIKGQEGVEGARRVFAALLRSNQNPSTRIAAALLMDSPERLQLLSAVLDELPAFGPAAYFLSLEYLPRPSEFQTLHERREELRWIGVLLKLNTDGHLRRHLLNQKLADSWLEDVARRVVSTPEESAKLAEPVTVSAHFNDGKYSAEPAFWELDFHVHEHRVQNVQFKLGGASVFTSIQIGKNETSGKARIGVPETEKIVLTVNYIDARGVTLGPYTLGLVLSQTSEELATAKGLLRLGGGAVYFPGALTMGAPKVSFGGALRSHGAVIKAIQYSFDSEDLGSAVLLPEHPERIPVIDTRMDGSHCVEVPVGGRFIAYQFTFIDGEKSKVHRLPAPYEEREGPSGRPKPALRPTKGSSMPSSDR